MVQKCQNMKVQTGAPKIASKAFGTIRRPNSLWIDYSLTRKFEEIGHCMPEAPAADPFRRNELICQNRQVAEVN